MELNFFPLGTLINALGFVWYTAGATLLIFIVGRGGRNIRKRIEQQRPWSWLAFRNVIYVMLTIGIFFIGPNTATSPKISLNPNVDNRQSMEPVEMREPIQRDLYMDGFEPLQQENR